MKKNQQENEYPIKSEIYSVERLEEYAAFMAANLKISSSPRVSHSLLPRMRQNGKILLSNYRAFTQAIHRRETIPPAAEWLTDNFHIVEDQLREIQEDLPPAYYKELPKLSLGELTGYPRIYAIALALIAHTDSELEAETIRKFIQSYQKISALTIGELWALAITLRLVLVENLRRLSIHILTDHEKRNRANQVADEIFDNVSDPIQFKNLVEKIFLHCLNSNEDDCAYLAQLAKRFRDQEPEIWPALDSLEKYLIKNNLSAEKIVHLSHQRQAANQVTVANIITSMRLLSSLNWRDFFESLSLVDRIFEKDSTYRKMDFTTRDRYRHTIEKLSKKTKRLETDITKEIVELSEQSKISNPTDSRKAHVGYYLIDRGFSETKKLFNYKTTRFIDLAQAQPYLTYFGLILLFLTLISVAPLYYAFTFGVSWPVMTAIFFLILIPCSELALSLTNIFLTHTIRPQNLPKIDLSKGLPTVARTMVVIPCMLSDQSVINELLEKIEIHFLGNSDNEIFFGLLTDFNDAANESTQADDFLLQIAIDGIERLNLKYASLSQSKFFLFHRRRLWNSSEETWMGWERKRGKIQEFNQLLRGHENLSFSICKASVGFLKTIRYVITLDADTQLPRDTAHQLVGTILHPLNQPTFDPVSGLITEGYGILQPRVGISLESSVRSYFSKIFSGYTGLDPYTTAVSEVYQDLFHEGSYTGKGLYDVDAFEAALENRVPNNTLLSHDLFEGLFARTALLTDIEVIDDYPQSYGTFFKRLHRWTRGDWQISPWILPFVKNGKKEIVRNRLSLISKWKILDNLRRSLVAPTTFLWILFSWLILPGLPQVWILYIIGLIIFPILVQTFLDPIISRSGDPSSKFTDFNAKTKTNVMQIILHLSFLAHQSVIQIDAIFRVFYRQNFSKKKLLEWATAAQTEKQIKQSKKAFWQTFWPTEFLLAFFTLLLIVLKVKNILFAFAFIALWMCYPLIAHFASQRLKRKIKPLIKDDQNFLRQIARLTWNYFETFVTANDNWLPPDNHQIFPFPLTAHRTSPTNIGLYLLSLISARDLGYISTSKFFDQLSRTLEAMKKLEQYKGHYLNWYDTTSLTALHPKYVSTVDSGNLAGYLIATKQACLALPQYIVVDLKIFLGLADLLFIIKDQLEAVPKKFQDLLTEVDQCQKILVTANTNDFSCYLESLDRLHLSFEEIRKKALGLSDILSWVQAGLAQIQEAKSEFEIQAPWTTAYFKKIELKISIQSPFLLIEWFKKTSQLKTNLTLTDMQSTYQQAVKELKRCSEESDDVAIKNDLNELISLIEKADLALRKIFDQAGDAALFLEQKFSEMDFKFLLDKDREVFVIGYNVSDQKFDRGLYDLLGSESRLASFVAIAKTDVKQEHWFRLGRQLVPVAGSSALVSWTASMFEYLMPLLVLKNYENTLLNETVHSVVKRQIQYGSENNIPWGVSEAGYNARDLQMNYQYGPFGVPGLGLKRGLSHDLVISPYSTLLAAQVNPQAAIENLKRLKSNQLLTQYGFYESVDYTRERLPENEKFAIVKSFMAHHQGMSLVAINNVIHHQIMQNRFHSDPRMRATRLLLQERIPQGIEPRPPKAAEIEIETQKQPTTHSMTRHYTDQNSLTPRIQLLSNRNYSLMISTAGCGYSKYDQVAITRWKEDATRDPDGSFIFIQNMTEKKIWSTTYQPFTVLPQSYKVTFSEDKVEFSRRDKDISTYTQILVAPEDHVEIRQVTLINHADHIQRLELTSYLEPVLGPSNNDLDHLAFSKLFIQTEFISSKNALLAKRRKRSHQDNENWGLHVVYTDAEILSEVQYETDRAKFIGRGRNLRDASAFDEGKKLTNSIGATIDPILSLRIQVLVPANSKIQVAFTTGFAPSREKALELADRYYNTHAFDRESKLAWTQSQVDMRHLNIDSQSAILYQRLAERILFSEPSLRQPTYLRAANTNKQSSLWPSGISGDLPIVVVTIRDLKDTAVIRKLLRCHEYLRLKGLSYDFIIINEHIATYHQELQDEIQLQIRTTGSQSWLNKNGGVFVLRQDLTAVKDIAHIQAVARVTLLAHEPLSEQVNRRTIEQKYPQQAQYTPKIADRQPQRTQELKLEYFNGLGGFSPDGKEYVTILQGNKNTPAPWINVIGNELGFGFQISESGSGFTWSVNSQTNRLTPWSNDPVQDPSGEIIYLRDDETGEIWTPTPLPIRSQQTYIIRHGQGYTTFEHENHGIKHDLQFFVPPKDPVKISLLKLKNLSGRKRKISITSYTEWVLGNRREKTSPFLVCDVDDITHALFARNPHDNEFADQIAFADISPIERTFTCNRKEFLGRNGFYENPAALKRSGLSKKRNTTQDPCAVLQTSITLNPGEEFEMSFLLGQCGSVESARELTLRYRDLDVVKKSLNEVIHSWRNKIDVVQIKTPEPSMNILMNNWLLYQTLSCRYWSRTAFYQSGGAYGFRDQLQDCMAFVYAAPELAKEQILRACRHQFKEGDVQHWWHPPTGRGIRTRMTDDLLWLPYVVSFYIEKTGDIQILEQKTTFLVAESLKPDQEDSYTLPQISTESESVLEHCLRAINRSLLLGKHQLPLIGTGDWNDGMNRVGIHGEGESIWLGWFLYKVITDFLPYCDSVLLLETCEKYKAHLKILKDSLEKNGWDGDWYKRAYFDDGTPLGSATSQECRIDSISQTWSVLSKAADPARAHHALEKVSELLIREKSKLILLLDPPFDQCSQDPGYIKGYIPGVRENGGQYTHAAIWVMMAFAEIGDGDQALKLFNILNPILRTQTFASADVYKIEPYVLAGDIYAGNQHEGRGGWSWYTGSSSWLYRAGLESILGFKLKGSRLEISPCIPKSWKEFELIYIYKETKYVIVVKNPLGLNKGNSLIELDGKVLDQSEINLLNDQMNHQVVVTLFL